MGTEGTDFLAQFPAGTTIPADGVIVVSVADGFEGDWGHCPDFVMNSTGTPADCGGGTVPAMSVPAPNGSVGENLGRLLSNAREMVVLFTWAGDSSDLVRDVDYVTWGSEFDDDSRVDKTGVGTYQPDTARASQNAAPTHANGQTIARCAMETGETTTGGNGIGGHDETSEQLGTSFTAESSPSPGAINPCLFEL
jgi:hypothetical protein